MAVKTNNRVKNEYDCRRSNFIVVPSVATEVHLVRKTLPAGSKKRL
jgi:hypothetical protein